MSKRFNPPSPHRIGAVAIAAALAAFAGVAAAQSRAPAAHPGFVVDSSGNVVRSASGDCVRPGQAAAPGSIPCPAVATTQRTASASGAAAPGARAQPGATGATASGAPSRLPGYAVSSDGQPVRSGFGECVRAGHWTPGNAAEPCERVTLAQAAPVAAASASPASARSAAAGAGGTAIPAAPGYVQNAQDKSVVLSGYGTCVRSGFWTPGMAAEPCDRVAVAQVEAPPVAVVTPEPKLEPAPAPLAQPAPPPPAPVAAVEPPRPVIQKLTLSTDVLFDFDKAELRDSGKLKLDELMAQTRDADVDEIVVVGHADRIASEGYNQKLSEERAAAVKRYLDERGAKGNRVTAEGRGESQPITGEDCKKMGPERGSNRKLVNCLQPDRRVEIEVLGSRQVAGGAPAAGAGTTGGSSAPASGGASSAPSGGGSTTR